MTSQQVAAQRRRLERWKREAKRLSQSLDPEHQLWKWYEENLRVATQNGLADALKDLVITSIHLTLNGRKVRKPSIPQQLWGEYVHSPPCVVNKTTEERRR